LIKSREFRSQGEDNFGFGIADLKARRRDAGCVGQREIISDFGFRIANLKARSQNSESRSR
jgi:hypothetical protein